MKDLRIALTCCGNTVSPGMIKCLKENGERKIDVLGLDMTETPLARHFADKFFQIPAGDAPDYLNAIIDLCNTEQIDVFLPCDDNEAIVLSKNIKNLKEQCKTKFAVSSHTAISTALNKISFHEQLTEQGIACAEFGIATNYSELVALTKQLGFPGKDVVIKPEFGFGGRGVRILTKSRNLSDFFNTKPGSIEIASDAFEAIYEAFNTERGHPRLLVMEYLPGDYYSVEVLSKDGIPFYIVPKKRILGSASCTTLGALDLNPEVVSRASEICRAFNFDFIQNYEMKMNAAGDPIVYDINPRIPASIAFPNAAGANLIYFAVKMAIDEEIPRNELKTELTMSRYHKELFI